MAGKDDPSFRPEKPGAADSANSERPDSARSAPTKRSIPDDTIPRSRSTLGMKWFSLGAEIMGIVVCWTLAGWFVGNILPATWPVVVCSLLGVAHALYHFLESATKP